MVSFHIALGAKSLSFPFAAVSLQQHLKNELSAWLLDIKEVLRCH